MTNMVLIHALGASHRAWAPQIAELAERHRVLAPDLPGHGDAPGPFTLDRAVASVRKQIADSEPAHLVAISGGVTVALLAAAAEPDRVASLTLSGGVARASGADTAQRTLMRLMPAGLIVTLMKGMYAGGKAEHLETAAADLRTAGKKTLLTGLAEIARMDLRPRLKEIKAPALVLVGDKDKANLAPARELAAGLPDAELSVIRGAGHIWNLERPETFSRTVEEFTRKVSGNQSSR